MTEMTEQLASPADDETAFRDGKLVSIHGAVVDVHFANDLPAIAEALQIIARDVGGTDNRSGRYECAGPYAKFFRREQRFDPGTL